MVEWRETNEADVSALVELAKRVLAVDGGLPVAAEEAFLRRRYLDAAGESLVGVSVGGIAAAAGSRPVGGAIAVIGMVSPEHRGEGLGTRLVDWALSRDAQTSVRLETESLTDPADRLFTAMGLHRTFAEDVMRLDLTRAGAAPEDSLPDDVALTPWGADAADRFFDVYERSFRDRPGFPGWSQEQWVDWHTGDDDFAPEWTLVASRGGEDVGFVACARGAWIVQVGVVPEARGAGLGAGLTAEALRRMRAAGEAQALLDVNANNPGARRVYERLGFATIGRRARYERS